MTFFNISLHFVAAQQYIHTDADPGAGCIQSLDKSLFKYILYTLYSYTRTQNFLHLITLSLISHYPVDNLLSVRDRIHCVCLLRRFHPHTLQFIPQLVWQRINLLQLHKRVTLDNILCKLSCKNSGKALSRYIVYQPCAFERVSYWLIMEIVARHVARTML